MGSKGAKEMCADKLDAPLQRLRAIDRKDVDEERRKERNMKKIIIGEETEII